MLSRHSLRDAAEIAKFIKKSQMGYVKQASHILWNSAEIKSRN